LTYAFSGEPVSEDEVAATIRAATGRMGDRLARALAERQTAPQLSATH
jgi:hypothetical protein